MKNMLLTWGLISGTLLLIGIIATFYIENELWKQSLQYIGFFVAVFIIGIVFGGVATSEVEYYKYEIVEPTHISRSEDAVFVQFDGFETQSYYLKSEYDKIDSTTIFLIRTSYNYYNFEIRNKIINYCYDKKIAEDLLNKRIYD